MNIIFFSHPDFTSHQSMPRFTGMLAKGMEERGHTVEIWSPKAKFFNLAVPQYFKKWMGYLDQYILFPKEICKRLKSVAESTLFVFTDHSLGPWVPFVAGRAHVIHCHDFLAQRSALNKIIENKTSWSGKQYQAYIRYGFKKGKYFISVSDKTRQDLHQFLNLTPVISEVVYNGFNRCFEKRNIHKSREDLSAKTGIELKEGYLLHVGGNQWYKNRKGVIEIYDTWRSTYNLRLPLLMIGEAPDTNLTASFNHSRHQSDIFFLSNMDDGDLQNAYSGASLLLYPSHDEGFGWPIAEAMASGCPVVTTNEPPMTEITAGFAYLIPRRPNKKSEKSAWINTAAETIDKLIKLSADKRQEIVNASLINAQRFNTKSALDQIELIYLKILEQDDQQIIK